MTSAGVAPTSAVYSISLFDRAAGRIAPGCSFNTGGIEYEFTRVLNDPSEMVLSVNVDTPGCSFDCECVPLARVHDIVAFRSDRPQEAAWCGPVLDVLEEPNIGLITITAKDRLWWLTGAPSSRGFGPGDFGTEDRNGEVSVVEVFAALLADAERYQPSGLVFPTSIPPDLSGVRVRPPTIAEGDSLWFYMQSYLGSLIDLTVVGQNLYWGSPEIPVTDGINLSAARNWIDGQGVSTDIDGEDTFTRVRVQGAAGIVAAYPTVEQDRGFGLRTGFISDSEITTQAEADAFARFVFERNSEPATFLISGDGSLNSATDLAVADLIPGRKHRIRGDAGCLRSDDRRRITAVVVSGNSSVDRGGFLLSETRVAVDFQPPGTEGDPQQVTA